MGEQRFLNGSRVSSVDRVAGVSMSSAVDTPLWREVLSGATGSNTSLDSKTMIVLGNAGVGKNTLVNSLRAHDDAPKEEQGMALKYTYMNFKIDEDDDQPPKLSVWRLSDPEQASLLRFAFKPQELSSTMVLIVADLKEPWAINKAIRTWLEITEKAVNAALDECPDTSVEGELQSGLQRFIQSYIEPTEDTGSPKSRPNKKGDDDEVLLPLGDGVLTKNLGIPIVIVCNKADAINTFESECEYQDSDFDFIQQHLRRVALSYGATLLYTAPRGNDKEHRGIGLLREYIAHRLFGGRFDVKAEVLEKDSVFVPTGYDSKEKISVLEDVSKTGEYEEVIVPPDEEKKNVRQLEEVVAKDDEAFLQEHQGTLAEAATSERRPNRALSFQGESSSKLETPTLPASVRNTSGVVEQSPSTSASLTPNSSAMLQNFFESLMKSESNEGLRKGVEEIIGDEKKAQENAAGER